MQHIRGPLREVFAQLDALLGQAELPEPSRRPLLDPATELLVGDLVVVASRHRDEAVDVLFRIVCDTAPARDVLLVTEHADRAWTGLIAAEAEVPRALLERGHLSRDVYDRVRERSRYIKSWRVEVLEATVGRDPIATATQWLLAHPNGAVFFLSPLVAMHDEEVVARFIRRLKTAARSGNGTVAMPWLLNNPGRRGQRPELRQLAGSGAVEDDADVIVLIGHDHDELINELRLAKNRHGQQRTLWTADPE